MITIKAPGKYANEPGVLDKSGPWIAALGRRAFVAGGKTAWEKTSAKLTASLRQAGVDFTVREVTGPCTRERIDELADGAKRYEADLVIGIGGGRALDLAKAAGDKLALPVVAVPTVPATCAAWSALTVLYDEEGRSAGYLPLSRSPEWVLADSEVLAAAPRRYLAAGIGDTIVKFYETGAGEASGGHGRLDVRIGLQTSRLALDIFREHALRVFEEADRGNVTAAFADVTDSIVLLAGLVGSISSGAARAPIAHAIHDSLTWFPETHGTLHGEKVAFGLIAQLALLGQTEEARYWAEFQHRLGLPVTLRQLGFPEDRPNVPEAIASGVKLSDDVLQALPVPADGPRLAAAIAEADRIGAAVRATVRS
ncbi:iron-containing alcohol dehydrogenase family protein [Cohnella thermotolerans]|uniref:iron-containing alcohol dehydrogenase family protein n=1 Tax=Cohnella thermotolerans TaxID=329858 RepID=UPI000406B438|nr:iron-containing alcohol dehydrogenase family protein [Cohnella thermotolerans]